MKSTKASIVICSWPVPSLEWVSPAISSWTKKCLTPSFLSHRQVVEPLPDPHRRAGKLIRCNAVVLDPAGSTCCQLYQCDSRPCAKADFRGGRRQRRMVGLPWRLTSFLGKLDRQMGSQGRGAMFMARGGSLCSRRSLWPKVETQREGYDIKHID